MLSKTAKNSIETKPKQKIIGSIFETYNYELFKTLNGNRDVNYKHVAKLTKSFEENYYLSPIIVNDDMFIIDGQHRFNAAQNLHLPIRYIIDSNAGLEAIKVLNEQNKNWNHDDFMNCYINLGNKEYVKYKAFRDKYKLPHRICQFLLSTKVKEGIKGFRNGTYKVSRYNFACKVAERVEECKEHYEGASRRSFVYAMCNLSNNKDFNFKTFISRLSKQKSKMYDCAKTSQYIELIEEIYNYRNRNKVNLRI